MGGIRSIGAPVEGTHGELERLREADRLATLRAYDVLDTPSEEAFDELARLAATICGTPVALVSLVDETRQWFKARVGLDADETPRDVAFCAHAIRQPEDLFVVPDTLEDDRFAENPLVTDGPRIRFYAGTPLAAPNGLALGTLCVIDRKPRDLQPSQLDALRVLGRQVIAQLELRRAVATLRERAEELERRAEEMSALRSMSELVQRCESREEAYDVFERFAPALFAGANGALYVGVGDGRRLDRAVSWGDGGSEDAIRHEACWALRRGRVHGAGPGSLMPVCEHARDAEEATTICVPLLARGEATGVLTVSLPGTRHEPGRLAAVESLAGAAGEQLALLLANLELRASLREQAIRDPLTGLYNRRYMEETLLREVRRAERKGTRLSVVMLDVDHFKAFNDSYGHDAGDAVLREVGSLLGGSVRAVDVACRFGGEEFTLILPDASPADVRAKIDDVLAQMRRRETRHDGWVLPPTTLSAGVAGYPECGSGGEALVRAADAALYEAKHAGRDRVVVAEKSR